MRPPTHVSIVNAAETCRLSIWGGRIYVVGMATPDFGVSFEGSIGLDVGRDRSETQGDAICAGWTRAFNRGAGDPYANPRHALA